MDQWLLRLLLFFVKRFAGKDIDFERLKIITQTKLLMDRRRIRGIHHSRKNTDPKNPLLITLLLYGFFGLMIAVMIAVSGNMILSLIFFHAYVLFMMSMTLITDFSAVLLDTTDNQILLPRPVNSKTLFMARLIHVLLYLLQFSVAICLVPIICTFIKHGPMVGTGMILTSQLSVLLAVFLTYLLYLLVLRFSTEQKIREIVTYFQIGMTLFFTIGYQLIPRMIDLEGLSASFTLKWYSFLLPPVWMAMSLEALSEWQFDQVHL
ncbi:MAG: hypothetical protein EOO03_13555, partial [Chitinophagaceae bacterium]